jgi:hypothetical protein
MPYYVLQGPGLRTASTRLLHNTKLYIPDKMEKHGAPTLDLKGRQFTSEKGARK